VKESSSKMKISQYSQDKINIYQKQ